jgi:stage II sporulation protein E
MSTLFTDISTPRATEIKAVLSSEVVSCAVPKKGEKECGDTVCHFVTSDLRQIVLLSDGMGSGNKASSASKKAVEMLKDLITAGAGIIAATEATVPVLEAKFESCGFVTLDLLQIDLKNGEAIFVKYGATPSYILRGDGQKQVWKQSLPAGLGDEGAVLKATLKAGDRIVMTSDGVVMPEVLRGEGRDVCELLVKGKSEDDKTALAVSIREA